MAEINVRQCSRYERDIEFQDSQFPQTQTNISSGVIIVVYQADIVRVLIK